VARYMDSISTFLKQKGPDIYNYIIGYNCFNSFSSFSAQQKASLKRYILKYIVAQISGSSIFVTERGMDLKFFEFFVNNSINIRVTVWHEVDFEERVDLGEGWIKMSVVTFGGYYCRRLFPGCL
jgi:hypothetical protein